MHLTVIILTKNEERHIARAISALNGIAAHCMVVDCGSTDRTCAIAKQLGAEVLTNPWRNYATQFNWALEKIPNETDWVMRLDADEIVTSDLAKELSRRLPQLSHEVNGIFVLRRMNFLGRSIKWGGIFPIRVLRIFRSGSGVCEKRWMDEHILVKGKSISIEGELIDDNLNSLSWWVEKHNGYASREVVDLLNLKYRFMEYETVADLKGATEVGVKRWIKEEIYAKLPPGFRAFAYFVYRYVVRFGFLDGKEGTAFHILQGFWYRYLVDTKLHEVELYMNKRNADVLTAIRDVLDIDLFE